MCLICECMLCYTRTVIVFGSNFDVTISECNEESFCQDGAIGGFSPPSRSLDLVVGTCLLL